MVYSLSIFSGVGTPGKQRSLLGLQEILLVKRSFHKLLPVREY